MDFIRFVVLYIFAFFVSFAGKSIYIFCWFAFAYLPSRGNTFSRFRKRSKHFKQNVYLERKNLGQRENADILQKKYAAIYNYSAIRKVIGIKFLISSFVCAAFFAIVAFFSPHLVSSFIDSNMPDFLKGKGPTPIILYILILGTIVVYDIISDIDDWKTTKRNEFLVVINDYIACLNVFSQTTTSIDSDARIENAHRKEESTTVFSVEKILKIASLLMAILGGILTLIASGRFMMLVIKSGFSDVFHLIVYFLLMPQTIIGVVSFVFAKIIIWISDLLFHDYAYAKKGDFIGRIKEKYSRSYTFDYVASSLIDSLYAEKWKSELFSEFIEMCKRTHIKRVDFFLVDRQDWAIAGSSIYRLKRPAIFFNIKKAEQIKSTEKYHQKVLLILGHELAHVKAGDYRSRRARLFCLFYLSVIVFVLGLISYSVSSSDRDLQHHAIVCVVAIGVVVYLYLFALPKTDKQYVKQIQEYRADRIGCIVSRSDIETFKLLKETDSNDWQTEKENTQAKGIISRLFGKQYPIYPAYPTWDNRIRELEHNIGQRWTLLDDAQYSIKYTVQKIKYKLRRE